MQLLANGGCGQYGRSSTFSRVDRGPKMYIVHVPPLYLEQLHLLQPFSVGPIYHLPSLSLQPFSVGPHIIHLLHHEVLPTHCHPRGRRQRGSSARKGRQARHYRNHRNRCKQLGLPPSQLPAFPHSNLCLQICRGRQGHQPPRQPCLLLSRAQLAHHSWAWLLGMFPRTQLDSLFEEAYL